MNTLKTFLDRAANQLKGDWLIMGGTVLPLLGQPLRETMDIDIVRVSGKGENEDTLQLMRLAESLGLPPETINQAGAFFLSKMKYSKKDLVLLKEGKRGRIYRPSATFFLVLKIGRMSQSDLADCKELLNYSSKRNESIERDRVLEVIAHSRSKSSEECSTRLSELQTLIEDLPTV
jgi:hypothetical protein